MMADLMTATTGDFSGIMPVNRAAPPKRQSGMRPLGQNTLGGTQTGTLGGMTPFTASQNLIGTQINPTNSAPTNQAQSWTSKAGSGYNGFELSPFKGVAPLNFDTENGMLGSANTAMQNTSYNFNPANTQYGVAAGQLAGAATGARGYLDAAASAAGNTSGGNGYTQAADVGNARAKTMQYLDTLDGPDRNALAAESLALLEERSNPAYQQSLRAVNQKSAAMGRRGSGVTTNELGDVTLAREKQLALARRDAALGAAGEQMNDRLSRVRAAQDAATGFGSLDQNAAALNDAAIRAQSGNSLQSASLLRGIGGDIYGMGADQSNLSMGIGDRYGDQARDTTGLDERKAGFTRGIANDKSGLTRDVYGAGVNERDTARADEYNQGGFLGDRFDRNAGYLNQNQTQDRNNRNEMRDERGYQYGLSRDAVGDELTRAGFEEQLRNGRYQRGMGTAEMGFGADSPADAYSQQGQQYSQNSADGYGLLGAGLSYAGQPRRKPTQSYQYPTQVDYGGF